MDRPVIFDWRQQLLVIARSEPGELPGVLERMHARWRTALWQEAARCFGGGIIHCRPRRRRYGEREAEQWLIAGGFHPDWGPLKAMGVPLELIPPVIAALARVTPWTQTSADMQGVRGLRKRLTDHERQRLTLGEPHERLEARAARPFYAAALEELAVVERELCTRNGIRRGGGRLSPVAHHWGVVMEVYNLLDRHLPTGRGHRRDVLDLTSRIVESWGFGHPSSRDEWPWPLHEVDSLANVKAEHSRPGCPPQARAAGVRRDSVCRLESWMPRARAGAKHLPERRWSSPPRCPGRRERLRQLIKNAKRRRAPSPEVASTVASRIAEPKRSTVVSTKIERGLDRIAVWQRTVRGEAGAVNTREE